MATTSDALGFVRVSTGSQDESTQITTLTRYARDHDLHIVKTVRLHGYSASKGEQEPALHDAIKGIEQGRWHIVLVTDSSRLDRRENAWAQLRAVMDIADAGGKIISVAEPNFATDVIDTAMAQRMNAEKSRVVKDSTWRGIQAIMANGAWHGPLPPLWKAVGERYHKVATCTNPDAVRAVYQATLEGQSLSSLARQYDTYPQSIRKLIRLHANMTGKFTCRYTYGGQTYIWQHDATDNPPVDAELWHAANRIVGERGAIMDNLGGRPVQKATSWISGMLPCPGCGGKLYVLRGKTLRCSGKGKDRRSCGVSGINLASVTRQVDEIMSSPNIAVYRYQRVTGNEGELAELKSELDRVRQTLATTDDDDEFDRLSARRRELREAITSFRLVPESYDMRPAGETLADLWKTGDQREILRAIMGYIQFSVTRAGHVTIKGMYPADTLIKLTADTAIRVVALGRQIQRLEQYRASNPTQVSA